MLRPYSSNPHYLTALMASGPAFLFDLDGTLVDSVYQHVLAWREALESGGIKLSVWRIHRRIGMSGGLFINALLRETGGEVSPEQVKRIQRVRGGVRASGVAGAPAPRRPRAAHAPDDGRCA